MKFKKMFSIVLMTVLCFNIVSMRVFADDVNNEDIGYEASIDEIYAQNKSLQEENTITNEEVTQQIERVFDSSFDITTYTEMATTFTSAATTPLAAKSYKESDLRLLSAIIYCEAQGESYAGKLAVGIVVMNRKSSSKFPNTMKGVIYQKNQFQPTRNGAMKKALKEYDAGKFTSTAEKACVKAAKAALTGTKCVTYKSKKINLKGYYFFSGYLSGCRVKIGNHQFK